MQNRSVAIEMGNIKISAHLNHFAL